jgi:peptide/nickel transport system substrate-binding protein
MVRRLTCVLCAAAAVVLIARALRPPATPETAGPVPTFPELDGQAVDRQGTYVGLWVTPREYEQVNGRAVGPLKQSPFLDGKGLPPVAERVGPEPLVVRPLESVGQHGGALQVMMVYGSLSTARLLAHDRDFKSVCPDLVKAWRFDDGARTLTLAVRRGLRWSDGIPFTADDILFWYEDILSSPELYAEKPAELIVAGELVKMTKVDDYTVRLTARAPIPLMELHLAHWRGQQGIGGIYECKHYMKQFHPSYVGLAEANRKAVEAGYTRWDELFRYREHSPEGPGAEGGADCPTMGPYVLESFSETRDVLVRNPYYYKVDPRGNQLPYIDKIVIHKNVIGEVANLKLMNGEMDFDIGLHVALEDAPALMQYQARGGYRALIWSRQWGSVVRYAFNLTHDDPVKRTLFNDYRFRLAMSLALDRGEINDNIFFGRAVPSQATVIPDHRFSAYFDDAFAAAGVEPDPDKARRRADALLDEAGLGARDVEGYRLGPDGKELTIWLFHPGNWTDRLAIHELVQEYWGAVGIRLRIKTVAGSAVYPLFQTGKYDVMYWHMDGVCDVRFPTMPFAFVPMDKRTIWGPKWSRWYASGGDTGEKPPPKITELLDFYRQMEQAPALEGRIAAGKAILRSQADNLWNIGTVSLPPHVAIAGRTLRNVPEWAPIAWDTFYAAPLPPEAFWFDDEARRSETLRGN